MYQIADYACCPHCDHDADGGPPHEDPCPIVDCAEGKEIANVTEFPDGND